jgi:hypothetical protein
MKLRILLFFLTVFSLISSVVFSQDFSEVLKAVDDNPNRSDRFGYSVSISGDYAVIGAPYEDDDENGENFYSKAGAAYIYKRVGEGNDVKWEKVQKIVASDRKEYEEFGRSVAIWGNYLAVGAPEEDEDENGLNPVQGAGAIYIFEKKESEEKWEEVKKVVASSSRDRYDRFGTKVSIWNNYMVVGDGSSTIRIYERKEIDSKGVWTEIQQIATNVNADGFGRSVSIWEDYLVVGAYGRNKAHIYKKTGEGDKIKWKKEQTINVEYGSRFGMSVSIWEDYIIVGSDAEDEYDSELHQNNDYAGAAYIFKRNKADEWEEKQRIIPNKGEKTETVFGQTVSIFDQYAIVGAPGRDGYTDDPGVAFIFKRDGEEWTEVQKLVVDDREEFDYFGGSIAIWENNVIIGASSAGSEEGESYIFEVKNESSGIVDLDNKENPSEPKEPNELPTQEFFEIHSYSDTLTGNKEVFSLGKSLEYGDQLVGVTGEMINNGYASPISFTNKVIEERENSTVHAFIAEIDSSLQILTFNKVSKVIETKEENEPPLLLTVEGGTSEDLSPSDSTFVNLQLFPEGVDISINQKFLFDPIPQQDSKETYFRIRPIADTNLQLARGENYSRLLTFLPIDTINISNTNPRALWKLTSNFELYDRWYFSYGTNGMLDENIIIDPEYAFRIDFFNANELLENPDYPYLVENVEDEPIKLGINRELTIPPVENSIAFFPDLDAFFSRRIVFTPNSAGNYSLPLQWKAAHQSYIDDDGCSNAINMHLYKWKSIDNTYEKVKEIVLKRSSEYQSLSESFMLGADEFLLFELQDNDEANEANCNAVIFSFK